MHDTVQILPAILLGGPEHAGKSVLLHQLTCELRRRHIPHYPLRACPDGEGNWANEAEQTLVRAIRLKGRYTAEYIALVERDLRRRTLPLLVDIGGRPTEQDRPLLRACTHAIILYREPSDLERWRAILEDNGLKIIAEIHSDLHGTDKLVSTEGVLRGTLSGLGRGQVVQSFVLDALLERVTSIFAPYTAAVHAQHLAALQGKDDWCMLVLDDLRAALGLTGEWWECNELTAATQQVQTMLQPHEGLALYGVGPGWLYAALAAATAPEHPWQQFDATLGWITPPVVIVSEDKKRSMPWLTYSSAANGTPAVLHFMAAERLDYAGLSEVVVPKIAPEQGLILSGRFPYWLLTAIVRAYVGQVSWIAVAYPQLSLPQQLRAVVVWSATWQPAIGSLLPVPECA